MRERPWASITGGILLVGAMSGAVKWCYEIEKLRREKRQSEWEQAIESMQRKIEKLEADIKREKGSSVSLTSITPDLGEAPEIVAEAWRRFQREKQNRATGISKFSKGRFG